MKQLVDLCRAIKLTETLSSSSTHFPLVVLFFFAGQPFEFPSQNTAASKGNSEAKHTLGDDAGEPSGISQLLEGSVSPKKVNSTRALLSACIDFGGVMV